MSANPTHCKRCGKPLTDPLSIAIGLGPECRGGAGRSRKAPTIRQRNASARVYRAQAFASGQPVVIGSNTYQRTERGWSDGKGSPIPDNQFLAWLDRYGLVDHESTVALKQVIQ